MIVEQMERRFFELKGKLDVGVVTEEQFKTEVQKLRFQDQQGRWWMLGAQSGKWYSYDGARWIPGQPPADARVPADAVPPPISSAVTESRETSPSLPPSGQAVSPVLATPTASSLSEQAVSPVVATPAAPSPSTATPSLPEYLPIAPRPRPVLPPPSTPRLHISGPIVIAGAAFLALIGVLVLWLLLDNFVPGKPISSFFGGLMGNGAVAARTPTAVAGTPNLAALLAQGDQLLAQSQIDVAITQYQNAAQLTPTSVAPLVRWSRALAFKGLTTDALAKAQQAVQRAPNDVEAQAQLCRAYAWNGQVNEAVAAGERAVQIDQQNVNARSNVAEAYLLARRMVDAQGAANAALQLAPASAEAHRSQAWVYTLQGQKENALKEWNQTVTLEPKFYFRHFEYGEVLRLYFNAPAEAVAEHQKGVSLYGAYIPGISRWGLALLAANKPQDAIAPLQRALTLDGRDADAYANLGLAFGMANQCAQAVPYFEQALKLDANNSLAQRGLADCKSGKSPTLPPPQAPQVPLTPPTVTPK
jgi:tetratricopeptide (TPR) repeat protein